MKEKLIKLWVKCCEGTDKFDYTNFGKYETAFTIISNGLSVILRLQHEIKGWGEVFYISYDGAITKIDDFDFKKLKEAYSEYCRAYQDKRDEGLLQLLDELISDG